MLATLNRSFYDDEGTEERKEEINKERLQTLKRRPKCDVHLTLQCSSYNMPTRNNQKEEKNEEEKEHA